MPRRLDKRISTSIPRCAVVAGAVWLATLTGVDARNGGGLNGTGPTPTATPTTTSTATPAGGSVIGDVLPQLSEARRRVDDLKAKTAALRKLVSDDVADIKRRKAEPEARQASYAAMFQAIRSAQPGIDSDIQAILEIGRGLRARAGR